MTFSSQFSNLRPIFRPRLSFRELVGHKDTPDNGAPNRASNRHKIIRPEIATSCCILVGLGKGAEIFLIVF